MNTTIRRTGAALASAAFVLSIASSAFAATPAKLTALVAPDDKGRPDQGEAWVRVLHGSPDAPAVDVWVDGNKAVTALAFKSITGYVTLPATSHAIKVCATGSTVVCPINVPALSLENRKKYTIAATNLLAKIEVKVITDSPADDESGKARVRVVHFSADTPAVDVLTADGATKLVDNLAYPNASDYLALDAGTYNVKVCAHANNAVCPLGPLALTVASGQAYSVFAIGSLTGGATLPPTDMAKAGDAPASTPNPFVFLVAAALVAVLTLVPATLARRSIRR